MQAGIDVQAELHAKTGSPSLTPARVPPAAVAPAPQAVQRLSGNKGHQPRRYVTHAPPSKIETTPQMVPLPESVLPNLPHPSPRSQPTPTTSHFSSPATGPTRSPNFFPQSGSAMSPTLVPQAQQRGAQPPLRPNLTPMQPPQRPGLSTNYTSSSTSSTTASGHAGPTSATTPASGKGFYPTPFQSHYDQLEQEYNAAADMVDDGDAQSPQGPAPYPQPFQPQSNMQPPPQPMQTTPHMGPQQATPHLGPQQTTPHLGPQQQQQQQQQQAMHTTPNMAPEQHQQSPFQQPHDAPNGNSHYQSMNANMNTFFDPYDPMLDADPFGLSASMHFPTQFSYDAR
ncbi:MAG: hypothetical protein INR71_00540 [Terriglobus roseus]|nr:hypothetical protein [Terriglobus roseus]